MQYKKVEEVRQEYKKGEINVLGFCTPRSKRNIHSATIEGKHIGKGSVAPLSIEEVIWDVELDTRLKFLTDSHGYTSLLTKNVVCEIDYL